jgi:hypothetical protein
MLAQSSELATPTQQSVARVQQFHVPAAMVRLCSVTAATATPAVLVAMPE